MAKVEYWFKQDLKKPVKVQTLNGNVFTLDNVGSLIGVEVYSDGEAVTLTGTVNGYVILPDETTVSVAGTRDGNKAYIALPQSALAYPGLIRIAIKLTNSSEITTLLAIVATVAKSRTDTVITPSSQIITDWSQQIAAEMQAVEDASAAQDVKIDNLKSASKPYVAHNQDVNIGTLESVTVTNTENKRIDKSGNVVTANGYYIGEFNLDSDYVYRVSAKAGSIFSDARFIQIEDADGNVIAYDIGTANATVMRYINGVKGKCRVSYVASSGIGVKRCLANTTLINQIENFNTLNGAAYKNQVTNSGTTKLIDLTLPGVYAISSTVCGNLTDLPASLSVLSNQNLCLVNLIKAYGNAYTLQKLYTMQGKEFVRTIAYVNSQWVVNDDWKPKAERDIAGIPASSATTIASMLDYGVYRVYTSVADNITDKPTGIAGGTFTLINHTNAFTGPFVIQTVIDTNNVSWRRIVQTNGTVFQGWKKTDYEFAGGSSNYFYGKKLVTAGDSYTMANFSGDYASYNGKNFGWYIAQRNGMTFVNAGHDGQTIMTHGTSSNVFSASRYQSEVPADTDYLTLWFGINDGAYPDNLGTINDTEDSTFYGAWNKVLGYYLENRPFMKVLIIVTVGTGTAFAQAIRDVAEKWGYPVLDWLTDKTLPAFFQKDGMSDTAKNLRRNAFGYNGPVAEHPNPAWHEYESTIIEARLRAI